MSNNKEQFLKINEFYYFSPSQVAKKFLTYPISINHIIDKNEYTFSPMNKNGYFLFYSLKGNYTLSTDKGTENITKNSFSITSAKKAQTYQTKSLLSDFIFLHFDGGNIKNLLDYIFLKSGFVFHVKNPKIIKKSLILLLRSKKEDYKLDEGEISSMIYEAICSCVFSDVKETQSIIDHEKSTILAEKYIWANLNNRLTVQEIAENANMSASHFSKIFKEDTGNSPYEYILNARLIKAKEFLLSTNKSVSQIASLVGFNSESNFIYFFTTSTGISPLKYRNNKRAKAL